LLFALDIFITFRTTISSADGTTEVTDTKQIAQAYLKGDFSIDLLSTIPFDLIASLFNTSEEFS
jgi:hypothetical protein